VERGGIEAVMNTSNYAESIVQTVREPLLVLDRDLRVKAASRSFYLKFKVTPEQTLGRTISELGAGQWNVPALHSLLNEVFSSDRAFNDYRLDPDFPDIGPRSVLINARRLLGDENEGGLILLALEDVTERLRMEAKLARQQELLRVTLASIGDAVIATNIDTRITFMNPAAEALTGWHQAEAMGRPLEQVFKIVNEETRNPVESPVVKAIRQGAVVGLANHTLLLARDGVEKPIDDSAAPIRGQDGNVIGVVLVFHDISERRRTEHLLEVSETRYRRLFEAAHDGILIVDPGTRTITDVNPFIINLLGFPRHHFIGKELWEIGVFRDKTGNQQAMEELKLKGSIRYENLPLLDRDGRRHPVEIVANVYQECDQSVIQCNIRDISARKRFEREREALLANEQAARMEAESANRSKDLFLATLSHEVRTPLNAIMGWATILRDKTTTDADLHEGMEVIERNCRMQAQLIEDVLDVSRIVSGKLDLDIRSIELDRVITDAMNVVRPVANAKGINLESDLDAEAGPVSCDPKRMQQVVWNLLSNSVKFSPIDATVRVTMARQGSQVRIQVTDDGPGIAPEFLPHVFDRFRQADSGTRRKLGGLGLGLSIVKHLVELHGGSVTAHSDGLGHGTTFTVNLPVRAVTAEPREPDPENVDDADALPPARLDGLRLLVVDDEPDARRLLGKVLEEAGGDVTAVGSASQALGVLATVNPHVLISDIAMPDQDGHDLIRQIRATGRNAKDLPAVALTAFAHKDDRRRVLMSGFQVHVAKPADPHELTALVASLAGRTG
jgi:PAS domain S-box-containing protein